jgi:uncharacterized BrkB/YihY/UPF0761 family membrane protein
MKRPRLLLVLPGAAATSILWLSAAGLFTVYVSTLTNYDSTYGKLRASWQRCCSLTSQH